jgi:CheY-like chemotaxis protein
MQQLLAKYNLRGVAVSGYGMEDDVTRAKQAGFVEHLTKPVNADQFLDVLTRVLAD